MQHVWGRYFIVDHFLGDGPVGILGVLNVQDQDVGIGPLGIGSHQGGGQARGVQDALALLRAYAYAHEKPLDDVTNAVIDALRPLGVNYINMPLSPMRVWDAIHRSEGASPQEGLSS